MATFTSEELEYVANVLQAAYDLRCLDPDDTDEVLEDFIEALENGETITIEEDELETNDFPFETNGE